MRERCRDLVGRLVRLTSAVQLKNGTRYPKGTLWRVAGTHRGTFTLECPMKVGPSNLWRRMYRCRRMMFEIAVSDLSEDFAKTP